MGSKLVSSKLRQDSNPGPSSFASSFFPIATDSRIVLVIQIGLWVLWDFPWWWVDVGGGFRAQARKPPPPLILLANSQHHSTN